MNARLKLTTSDLERGLQAAQRELEEARAAHARCAYDHALDRNDESARQALIQSKQRLDLLESELQGLTAATGEARRLERLQMIDHEIKQLEADRLACESSGDIFAASFKRAAEAIASAGLAVKELEQAKGDFYQRGRKCVRPYPNGQAGLEPMQVSGLVDALLWLAVGTREHMRANETVMTMGGKPMPENASHILERDVERTKERARVSVSKQIEELREEAAKLA